MINPKDDGVNHINIYSAGKTKLGSQLSNMYKVSVFYKNLKFTSVEHAWHYFKFLPSNPELALRILGMANPFEVKKLAKKYVTPAVQEYAQTDDFKNIIIEIIEDRINRNMPLMLLMVHNELPYKHYYVFKGHVKDESIKYKWLIEAIKNIQTRLKKEFKNVK